MVYTRIGRRGFFLELLRHCPLRLEPDVNYEPLKVNPLHYNIHTCFIEAY
jgi:hypothetical protein